MDRTIELDCAPGYPRPSDLIDGVLVGTGLTSENIVSKCFGNWTWQYKDVSDEDWDKVVELVKPRIRKLYDNNKIRYGSW